MKYIVKLGDGCWLTRGMGDPSRTRLRESAQRYDDKSQATYALGYARRFRDFDDAVIEQDEAPEAESPKHGEDTRELACLPMSEDDVCRNTECRWYDKSLEQNCGAATEDEGPYAEVCLEWDMEEEAWDPTHDVRLLDEAPKAESPKPAEDARFKKIIEADATALRSAKATLMDALPRAWDIRISELKNDPSIKAIDAALAMRGEE
jgi:hypothetical protein